MLQRKFNKYSGTKQVSNARKGEEYRSHDKRDDHKGYRKSRTVSRHNHSP
jgi:hypothetical protein